MIRDTSDTDAHDGLQIAMVGHGFMGRIHANAWRQVTPIFDPATRPTLSLVSGRRAGEVADFARRWGWARWTDDWRELVNDPAVDVVDIVTPNSMHRQVAVAALSVGKHVICEKPVGRSLDDALAIAAAAQLSSAQAFVWYNMRRIPAVALAYVLARSGHLGRIYHFRAVYSNDRGNLGTALRWRHEADIAGYGAHGDLNSHLVDLCRFITGQEVNEVSGAVQATFVNARHTGEGIARPVSVDDAFAFVGTLSGGGLATFEATRNATGYANSPRFEVQGELGALRFDFSAMNQLDIFRVVEAGPSGWTTVPATAHAYPYSHAWWPEGHGLGFEHAFVNQAADMLQAFNARPVAVPLATVADAVMVHAVLAAAAAAAQTRRSVVVESASGTAR